MITAVHQFHPGSAAGDAVTKSMLLIRSLLRASGFRSDIFVASRDPALGPEIYDYSNLPVHADYVLLLHHSMGNAVVDEVASLPARKVLMYHNITPPALIDDPYIQRCAAQGRAQLAAMSGQMDAALADSAFNAVELQAAGYAAPQVCPLLFDVAELRRRAAPRRARTGPFTIMFAGRIVAFKAQDDLIAAFAAFRAAYGAPCRLVLPGAMQASDASYLHRLDIMAGELDGSVILPGLVPDGELHAWFTRADLYVSLSRHEGFGVPLVEAMAHGVPVLAWPAGAVPYTLGDAGELLTERGPEAVAARMLALAADPARRAAMVASQDTVLAGFELDRHVPVLLQALARAGAVSPDRAAAAAYAANMRFTITGHTEGSYSLAAVNRAMARAIETVRPGAVQLIPIDGEAGEPFLTGPTALISQHYPVHVPVGGGHPRLAMVFWEESLLPAVTIAKLNAGFEALLAPSAYVAKALRDSGLALPLFVIGQAPPLPIAAARTVGLPFTFLHISSAFPRKGIDVLLAAWTEAFGPGDDVRLVIKTFPNPHNDAAAQIAALNPAHAPIALIDRDLTEVEMRTLYTEADCMVLPARGEGYNLVAAETMAAGLQLIVTALGGHMDFCSAATARLLPFRHAPSGSHLATAHSTWAEPSLAALTRALREAPAAEPPPEATRREILRHTEPAAFVERLARAAAATIVAPPPRPLRLAWVSSWNVRCGVAEYSRALLAALPRAGIGMLTIVCDDRTPARDSTILPSGHLGDRLRGDSLLSAIMRVDADAVVIQHQPGLLGWEQLACLLDQLAPQRRAVLVTLHNTRSLLDLALHVQSATIAALGRVARVLVHTLTDLNLMESLGLGANTALLPHGTPQGAVGRWRRDGAPIIGCTGFFLPGKGIGTLIAAVAQLRPLWPGIRLRLVCADYGSIESTAEIARCRAIALAAGLDVDWHGAFVSPAEQAALLGDCLLIVLPTEPSLEASSASLRTALVASVPVAVTPIALFDEAAGAVWRLPGWTAAEIATGIDRLLSDPAELVRLQRAGAAWLAARAWPAIGERLAGMLRGFVAQSNVDVAAL